MLDSFGTKSILKLGDTSYTYYSLRNLEAAGFPHLPSLPYSLRVLLENLLRSEDGKAVTKADIAALASWNPAAAPDREIAFAPTRVVLQDFTGVPAVADLAAMRDAVVALGGDAAQINPLQPADLVIDHSVQVDRYGSADALAFNARVEFERNKERYVFLRWGQRAFQKFRVVPPDTGIVHQVNLEYLAEVVSQREQDAEVVLVPDTLVGTDSHTVMINGLGVLGWGVGGIEAEAVMLGQPISMLIPQVVGFELTERLPAGVTATDLVLTITQRLREVGVVEKFVEFYGSGVSELSLADRATISNMAPEYGATIGFFPVDVQTLEYLRFTGRSDEQVARVEAYCRAQGLFRTPESATPTFSQVVRLDLSTVRPSLAGPKRPQDRLDLGAVKLSFRKALSEAHKAEATAIPGPAFDAWMAGEDGVELAALGVLGKRVSISYADGPHKISHGAVAIAAITSCTNTSNPSVIIAAGLLAKAAAEHGLRTKPWVKTSLAPGSQVVTEYLKASGLLPYLQKLGFHLVGYGCTTCIGNSGPLSEKVSTAIVDNDLLVAAVLSGNRNFEGRISPLVRANYLASPPLVVAFAIAGTVDIDLEKQPLGHNHNGKPVYLADIWPTPEDVQDVIRHSVTSAQYRSKYADVFTGPPIWRDLKVTSSDLFAWDAASTYIKRPPFFDGMSLEVTAPGDVTGARILAILGDSVTTDHISPAGSISAHGTAGKYLIERGVPPAEFNSYGARRGNHEVMIRGTFANIRLRNLLVPGSEGSVTKHFPSGEQMTIFDAATRYAGEAVPLVLFAGREYGTGSSRDWAAKGTMLLGVRAVIAQSFERIHRSNLVGMGVLPLQLEQGVSAGSLRLRGDETVSIRGISDGLVPGMRLQLEAVRADGTPVTFSAVARIDTPNEIDYYRHGGILRYVLRNLISQKSG
ncbi:MAG: aconitate hydratase AcnA [Candidatus Schekmanbacteria bacterium]|nr:aconitate hydratase AcnA [Candidatus Schekmanbacteria bacterium]